MNIKDIDKDVLKAAIKEVITEDPSLFKEALKEIIQENEVMDNSPEKVRRAVIERLIDEDFDELDEVFKALA